MISKDEKDFSILESQISETSINDANFSDPLNSNSNIEDELKNNLFCSVVEYENEKIITVKRYRLYKRGS